MTSLTDTPPTTTADDPLHAPMPTRVLGSTGHRASLLTLGGVKWDTRLDEDDAIALIHRAIDLGVNTFDTAVAYGNGQSEARLGKALEGRRDAVWLNTKTTRRDYDDACRQIDESLERLRTDRIDLFFIHGIDNDDDLARVLAKDSVLQAIEKYRDQGVIRFAGVSGHWYKHNMQRLIEAVELDAVLLPAGLFNVAYDYDYFAEVVPAARQRKMAVLGMKVFGAGRVQHAASIEPYLRYSLNLDLDTAVIGCDSIAQLEQTVRIIKQQPPALSAAEIDALKPEAVAITQDFDKGEFGWVSHYRR